MGNRKSKQASSPPFPGSGDGGCNQSLTVLPCFVFLLAPFLCSRVGSPGAAALPGVCLLQLHQRLQWVSVPLPLTLVIPLFLFLFSLLSTGHFLPFHYMCFPRGAPHVAAGSALPCSGSAGAGWNCLCLAQSSLSRFSQKLSPLPLPALSHQYVGTDW